MAAIDGVDCLWVGHFDLSVSLGIPGEFDHPTFTDAIDKIDRGDAASTTRRSAASCRPSSRASSSIAQGFDFICYSGDVWVLHNALAEAIGKLRDGCQVRRGATPWPTRSAWRSRATSGRRTARRPIPTSTSTPLRTAPGVEMAFLEAASPLRAEQLEDFDALILLAHRFAAESVPKSGRLAVVARFGVGYDTVDVEACTQAGIALVITPDGVRRPVAVSILTLMLALTGKLMVKDRLTREAAAGLRQAVRPHGRRPRRPHPRLARHRQYRRRGLPPGRAVRHDVHRPRPLRRQGGRGRARHRAGRARGAVPPRRRRSR